MSEVTAQIHTEGLSTSSQFDILTTSTQASARSRRRHCVALQALTHLTVALQLTDKLSLKQNLCIRHLILRSAFLGVVHFDQEAVSFNAKQRWNMVRVSCAMSDSHSAYIRYCWNRLLWNDASTVLQTLELQTWSVHAVKWKLEHNPCNPPWEKWLAPLKQSFLDGLPDLSGSCCHITLWPLATATFVAVYGVLCVLIQACPIPKRLGRCWFCFKRTGIGKLSCFFKTILHWPACTWLKLSCHRMNQLVLRPERLRR